MTQPPKWIPLRAHAAAEVRLQLWCAELPAEVPYVDYHGTGPYVDYLNQGTIGNLMPWHKKGDDDPAKQVMVLEPK